MGSVPSTTSQRISDSTDRTATTHITIKKPFQPQRFLVRTLGPVTTGSTRKTVPVRRRTVVQRSSTHRRQGGDVPSLLIDRVVVIIRVVTRPMRQELVVGGSSRPRSQILLPLLLLLNRAPKLGTQPGSEIVEDGTDQVVTLLLVFVESDMKSDLLMKS